ncbi:dephospho-CoA kinase [Phorcysia thermohydrogeniphila]|uniref:Dephospho-CoA kinase n=1 Tax=Phorcysia thermohydrogeniphila TaxID=936138 RepID=A0A4R1GIC3_9BACT|nr:dephospho-CoA kinase [Phorcysia thermohydrogeniphila]
MLVGITGNIGAGKSTVSNFLRAMGYHVFNADFIAKRLLLKGFPAYNKVVEAFGKGVLREDGEIDTKKLGEIVFSSREKLNLLTSITHPLVLREIGAIRELYKEDLAFLEAAVLFEYRWEKHFDKIVTVFAYRGQRLLRAAKRFGLKEAIRRDKFQLPYSEKLRKTDYLICNTKDMLHLRLQVEELVKALEETCG